MMLSYTPPPTLSYRYVDGRWELDMDRSRAELADWKSGRARANLAAAIVLSLAGIGAFALFGSALAALAFRFIPW